MVTTPATRVGIGFGVVGTLCLALSPGCAVDGSPPDATQKTAATSESLLGICTPLLCCFPEGGAWDDDPFEDGLRALGCSRPAAYTESYEQSKWWLYSTCPASVQLAELVLQYADVAPYYSQLVVNECLELHAIGNVDPTEVFVQWDPTCSSCSYSFYR
jgi:hypothetical protein